MINNRMKLLRCAVLSAGVLGMLLRAFLYATAVDHKGLLASNHWATWTILTVTGLILAVLLVATWKLQGPGAYEDCFPVSFCQGITSLLAAAVIAFRSLALYAQAGDSMDLAASLSGIAAGIALITVGICRFTGKHPSFLCHSALCLFFALQMICQYRRWSADPQLMNYGFYLLAFICLMLNSYFLAGFDAGIGSHRASWFFSMAAAFFSCLAIPESGDAGLLSVCALWAFCCAPQCQAKPRRQRPVMTMDEETEHADS